MAEENFFTDIALAVADAMAELTPEIKRVVGSDMPFMQKPKPVVSWTPPKENVNGPVQQ